MDRLKRYGIISFLFLLILSIFYTNYKFYNSYKFQKKLFQDWNEASLTLPLEEVLSYDTNFPDVSFSGLPLPFMKGRYLVMDSLLKEEGLKMLYQAEKINKYLGVHNNELAGYYLGQKNIDSAYANSKKAFDRLPNNVHVNNFFNILSNTQRERELDSAFIVIKDNKKEFQWRDYMFKKTEKFENIQNDTLMGYLKEAASFFVDKNSLNILKELIDKGPKGFGNYVQTLKNAEKYFLEEDFENAITYYTQANLLAPNEATNLYNLGICYYKLSRFEQAISTFERFFDEFQSTGLEEMYTAACYFELGDKENGCKYAYRSDNMGYEGADELIELFCR